MARIGWQFGPIRPAVGRFVTMTAALDRQLNEAALCCDTGDQKFTVSRVPNWRGGLKNLRFRF